MNVERPRYRRQKGELRRTEMQRIGIAMLKGDNEEDLEYDKHVRRAIMGVTAEMTFSLSKASSSFNKRLLYPGHVGLDEVQCNSLQLA